jgi:hypothetical protein
MPCGSAALLDLSDAEEAVGAGDVEGDLGGSDAAMVDCEDEVLREKVLVMPRWVLWSFCVIFLVGFHDMMGSGGRFSVRYSRGSVWQ